MKKIKGGNKKKRLDHPKREEPDILVGAVRKIHEGLMRLEKIVGAKRGPDDVMFLSVTKRTESIERRLSQLEEQARRSRGE